MTRWFAYSTSSIAPAAVIKKNRKINFAGKDFENRFQRWLKYNIDYSILWSRVREADRLSVVTYISEYVFNVKFTHLRARETEVI